MTEDQIIQKILENRGLKTKKQIQEFIHPLHPSDLPSPIDSSQAIKLINSHIKKGNKIFIYGDYDVDGVCATAILWETLYSQYKNVFPHIPHRRLEGYGLSPAGIDHCLQQGAKLIITVDNGIVANDAVKYCRDHDCDIIIIDHHEAGDSLPSANAILHSTSTCATGLTWFFCRDYGKTPSLDLTALAVVCDIVPLLGLNRSFAKHGLEDLNKTTRPGLLALFAESGLNANGQKLTAYHVGFIIGPRLNAMGRLEHALDSLRLLCTRDPQKARDLAKTLGEVNRTRQHLTESSVEHALQQVVFNQDSNLIIAAHESYDEGIIGLIAAKLAEKYHRPAIAISIGETSSKGSARSIPGFHITDHLRQYGNILSAVGGHAMAAGFGLENINLEQFKSLVTHPQISPELLVKKSKIDCEIPLSAIDYQLFTRLKELEPYGLGNPKPVFLSKNIEITNLRHMGKNNQHLKFQAGSLEAVFFNAQDFKEPVSDSDIVYSIDENIWNGQSKLQLVVKEIQSSHEPAAN